MRLLQPLRHKLALLISALLVMAVGGFGWFANERIHRVIEDAARRRLVDAAQQVTGMLSRSLAQQVDVLRPVAAHPAVQRALRERSPASIAAAEAVLGAAQLTGTSGAPARQRVLVLPDCTPVVAVGVRGSSPACTPGSDSQVSPLFMRGDSVAYTLITPVPGATGDTLGFLTEMRVLAGGGVKAVEDLIGPDARLLVGNSTGELWTDLARRVAVPFAMHVGGAPYHATDSSGVRQFAVGRAVSRTPWVVSIQVPHRTVVAPARELLASMIAAAILAVLVGAIGAYRISHHVTTPLEEIRSAASGIAAGDYTRRVTTRRTDELGALATMFNSMAEQVETATSDLKEQALELEERMDALQTARRDTRAAHSLLDDVLASAPVGVAVFDRQLRLLKVNAAMAELTGHPTDDHLARPVRELDATMGGMIEPLLQEVVERGTPIMNHRISTRRQAGTTRHWLTSMFPVRDPDGTISGAGLVVLDTTAHQELEERYLQSQKMEAVGRLAGGVAHDFNNLLTVILSYSSIALESAPESSDLANVLEEIRDAGLRASSLTRQLLAFSRHQVMQPQSLDLNVVAANMESMLQRLIGEDITLDLRLADRIGTVRADPGQVEQVIMNLVVNARDAMPNGGRLTIETGTRWFSSELSAEVGAGAGEYAMLSVADTGVGMTWEVQRHLFEPFFTTKEEGRGTGLGLSTVYGIVKQSAGDIHVESAPGRGTRFTIYLPVATSDAMPSPMRLPGSAPATGTETVLLLEDDLAVQTLGSRLLRRAGYRVLDARTPSQALEIARTHPGPIDLLLSDVVLPEMNGAAAAEMLTSIRPGMRTLFMSGYTADEMVRRGVSGDPAQFLEKPFTPLELTRKVRDILDAPAPAVT